jgi:hypothetical protein
LATGQVNFNFLIEFTLQAARDDGGTGAGAAGQCLADAPFVHAQIDATRVPHGHEADIRPLRESLVGLDERAETTSAAETSPMRSTQCGLPMERTDTFRFCPPTSSE